MWKRICREVEAPIRCGGLGLGVPKEKTLTAFLVSGRYNNIMAKLAITLFYVVDSLMSFRLDQTKSIIKNGKL